MKLWTVPTMLSALLVLNAVVENAIGQNSTPVPVANTARMPSMQDIAYGPHERQKMDVYLPASSQSAPAIVMNIHGGGWVRGDKTTIPFLEEYVSAGLAVVSINYRFTWQAQLQNVDPPVQWPLEDVVRAIQFVRSKSKEWNIDGKRIGVTGGSAGGCSSLYIALHDDFAKPDSSDPIERESTRVTCAATSGAQTSLDPHQTKAWIPNSVYGGHAFGFMDPTNLATRDTRFGDFYKHRDAKMNFIRRYSPWELVSPDDPPLYLEYGKPPTDNPTAPDPTHSANFGVEMKKRCEEKGVSCELMFPGAEGVRAKSIAAFFIDKLR